MIGAGELVRLCRDDYHDAGPPAWAGVANWIHVDSDDVAVYYQKGRRLVVLVRGTESPSNLSRFVREWLRDLMYRPKPWLNFAPVHEGFSRNVAALWGQLLETEAVSQYLQHGGAITLTGHSRGGAIAMMLATLFGRQRHLHHKPAQVVTFGAPRVGGPTWRDKYHALRIPTTRVENQLDPVPLLPPFVWYRHVGRRWIANPRLTATHHIDEYVEGFPRG